MARRTPIDYTETDCSLRKLLERYRQAAQQAEEAGDDEALEKYEARRDRISRLIGLRQHRRNCTESRARNLDSPDGYMSKDCM